MSTGAPPGSASRGRPSLSVCLSRRSLQIENLKEGIWKQMNCNARTRTPIEHRAMHVTSQSHNFNVDGESVTYFKDNCKMWNLLALINSSPLRPRPPSHTSSSSTRCFNRRSSYRSRTVCTRTYFRIFVLFQILNRFAKATFAEWTKIVGSTFGIWNHGKFRGNRRERRTSYQLIQ